MSVVDVAAALTALRSEAPLVQCLTNIVVANWTANVLLAAGAFGHGIGAQLFQ